MPTKRDTGYPPQEHVPSKINAACPTRCQLVIKMPRTHQKYHTVHTNISGGTQNARWPPKKCRQPTKINARWPPKERLVAYQDGSWPRQRDMPKKPKCWVPTEMPGAHKRKCWVVKEMPGGHLVKNSG